MDGADHLGNGTMIARVNAWQHAETDRRIAEYQAEKDNLVEKPSGNKNRSKAR
jgi:hypothetical protein